jgi:outer membrane receptor protein involved in Fe transport
MRPVAEPKWPAPARDVISAPSETIVVTGQKRRQALGDVPTSVTVVPLSGDTSGRLTASTRDLALSVEGFALTNLGPGRNRQFIRGVADSPFNGASQSTVAVQLDETRLTFDAPDPDLRLVDMERVEILKGPQGPLYGTGALGGIYHMVSVRPDLAVASGRVRGLAEAIQHGGLGIGGEAVLNVPLVTDRLAVRGVGYSLRSGGWIDNLGRNQNANRTKTDGGRLALRWTPDADWTIDLSGVFQDINPKDSQYVPAEDDTVKRQARIAEPADNDFKSVAATIEGRIGALKMLATSSYVDHGVDYTLDATDASRSFGLTGVSRFVDDRAYSIRNHEVRVTPEGSSNWLAGLSYMRAQSRSTATVTSADTTIVAESLNRKVTELAAFGEASLSVTDDLKATAGLRLSRSIAEDEALERSGGTVVKASKTIASPSLSLAWTSAADSLVYLRYARAMRPGGLAPAEQATTRRFDADELGSFDLGFRHTAGRDLCLAGSVFYTMWSDIQSDYLLENGLVSTRNSGKGRILGVEGHVDWKPFEGFTLSAGASYVDAHLVKTADGIELEDRRLPITPNLTGRLSARYLFAVDNEWATDLSAQVNYVGRARLTFDETLDRGMGDYAVASAGGVLTHGRFALGMRVDNLFDIKGDSFAFGNPFSIMLAPQYTPLRPRTFSLSVSRSW